MEEFGLWYSGLGKLWNASSAVYGAIPVRGYNNTDAEGDFNCGTLAQEASEKNSIKMWPRYHSYILVKNVTAFFPSLKCLWMLN